MERNIAYFGVYKIFTKRVFLPLTTIYASQAAGLSISQIGLTSAFASGVSLFFESPTGYWADTHGRRRAAQVGAALSALSTLLYVFGQNFTGILVASITMAIGYAFLSGAMEALIHDSLIVLGKEKHYAKIASRAQALSLVVNALFVALVPLLYPIDKRLPFVAGFIAYVLLFIIASLLTEPAIKHDPMTEEKNFRTAVSKILTKYTWPFFVSAGFIYAAITGITDVFNLGFIELGLRPEHMGFIFGAASLLGAVIGMFVHHLKRLSLAQYAIFDVALNTGMFISFGLVRSLPVAIGAFMLNMALWRYQKIMYQHYVLELYGSRRYKATMLSIISNFGLMHEIWLVILFSGLAGRIGILPSLSYGVLMMALFLPVFLVSIKLFVANSSASTAPSNQ
jgi:MFS family permease